MKPDGIYFVTTDEERRAVERLRYEGYIERMRRIRPTADHDNRLLPLPADEYSPILYAVEKGEVVGTMRIRHGKLGPYTEAEQKAFAPDMFTPEVALADTVIQDAFVIRADHLGGPVRLKLFFAATQYVVREKVEAVFCDCMPHLLGTYQRIGFRTYKPNFDSPDAGILVPLVVVVHDLDYLESIKAPILPALKQPGLTWDREHGKQIAARISTHPYVVARDRADKEDYFEQVFGSVDVSDHPFYLFDGLSPEDTDKVMKKSNIIEAREGEALVRKGRGTRNLFLVLDGTVSVKLPAGRSLEFDRGEVFGEVAFFLGQRTADVVVSTETARVLGLSDSVMRELQEGEPRIAARLALNLGRVLSSRLTGFGLETTKEHAQ